MYLKEMKRFFRIFRLFIIIVFPCCASAQINTFYSTEKHPLFNLSSDSLASCSNDSLAHNVIIFPRLFVISDNNKTENTLTYIYGVSLHSNFTKKLNFRGAFDVISESHHSLLNEFKDSLTVFPTFGRENKRLQYNCSYQFNKFITADFGKGKHFIGNGYRSLLLSAEHSPYPYLKLTTEFGRVRYYNLYTTFLDIQNPLQDRKKHATLHFLEFSLTKNINIGVFESILWQSKTENVDNGFEFAYMNPVIFFRPVEFSMYSNKGNVLMGANINATFYNTVTYAQVLLDDLNISKQKNLDEDYEEGFFQNKYAYQLGLKRTFKNAQFLIEYNQVQPYTYGHRTIFQNYSHMYQSLAHPLGANFKEIVIITDYKKDRWNFRLKITSAKIGLDSLNTHYGQNIFAPDHDASTGGQASYGNFNGQGVLTTINTLQTEITYPLKWITVFGSIMYKAKKSDLVDQTSVWYSVGVRTFPFSTFTDY